MALVLIGGQSAEVSSCKFTRTVADGCRLIDVKRNSVTNNTFKDVNDDSVAIHTLDSSGDNVDNSAIVSSNNIVDSQGIAVLGAKRTVISNNAMTRVHTRAIIVGPSSSEGSEGNTAPVSISITGNVITDVFDGSVFSSATGSSVQWIYVRNFPPSTINGSYVRQSDGAEGILLPWPYFYTNNIDTNPPNPGAWFINISSNICVRTLTTVSAYSNYGYGTRYGRSGPVDPAITESAIVGDQIVIKESANNSRVSENIVSGGRRAIYLQGVSGSAYNSWNDISITGNNISNFTTTGIHAVGSGSVKFAGNIINGDPLIVSPERAAGGTWGLGRTNHSAIWFDGAKGEFLQNSIKNVGVVFRGTTLNDHWWDNNTIYCDPVGLGYNAGNIGIGEVPNVERMGVLVIEDGNPSSVSFGRILNTCLRASTSIPTAGKYTNGHLVRHAAPTINGTAGSQYIILGWMRLTTGSGHILNTDWREMRCLTGT